MAQLKNTLYIPKEVEPRWSAQLADFSRETEPSTDPKKSFSLVFSLKSILSTLGLSDVLQYSLQDCYVRFKRMKGYEVLYLPGILYESELQSLEQPYKKWTVSIERKQAILQEDWLLWKDRQIKSILRHLQWMGISCDYSQLHFSREEPFQKAVRRAFIQLYEEGVLASRPHLIDWCFNCKSFLNPESLIEKEEEAPLYQVRFPIAPLKNAPPEKEPLFLNVWMEHLELVFGIQGFLLPSYDDFSKKIEGRSVILPFTEREVPIFVDSEFSRYNEIFPIIPGHSKTGFRLAKKYNLRMFNVFTSQGMMNAVVGNEYVNLSREECRAKIIEFLKEKGWLKPRDQEYKTLQNVKKIKCFRCGSTAENILFNRWHLKLYKLVQELETRLPDKEIRLQRKIHTRQISRFLDPLLKKEPHLPSGHRAKMLWRSAQSTQEWPITSEHWDGVLIPLWYCDVCGGKTILSETTPEKCPHCQGSKLRQEQGVFAETFFHWLWPLVALGWPDKKHPRYQQFLPNDLAITSESFESLGKMVLGSAHFAQAPPFRTLYLSGTIHERPRKEAHLSLESMIKRYGADSIRFSLLSLVSEGRNLKLSPNWYRAGQKFVNKLWNLSLFLRKVLPLELPPLPSEQAYSFEDRWILSNLHRTLDKFTQLIEAFQFQKAMHTLWKFIFQSLGFYLEIVKDRLYLGHPDSKNFLESSPQHLFYKVGTQHCLVEIFHILLKLTHIVCPFVTEEIWFHLKIQCMAFSGKELMLQEWPHYDSSKVDGTVEREMKYISEAVCTIRKLLNSYGRKLPRPRKIGIVPQNPTIYEIFITHTGLLRSIFRGEQILVHSTEPSESFKFIEVLNDFNIYLESNQEDRAPQRLQTVIQEIKEITYQIEACKVHMGNQEHEKLYRSVFPLVVARKKLLTDRYQRLKKYAETLKRLERRS